MPQLGQTIYLKTNVNGHDYYSIMPWAGNVPYGYTAFSKQEFISAHPIF